MGRELSDAERQMIVVLMSLRREYSLKAIARRFHVSVPTLYRVWRRAVNKNVSQASEQTTP